MPFHMCPTDDWFAIEDRNGKSFLFRLAIWATDEHGRIVGCTAVGRNLVAASDRLITYKHRSDMSPAEKRALHAGISVEQAEEELEGY